MLCSALPRIPVGVIDVNGISRKEQEVSLYVIKCVSLGGVANKVSLIIWIYIVFNNCKITVTVTVRRILINTNC